FRDYVTALPPYMNPWYGRNKLPGLKSLKYDEHGTTIKILSSADSEVKAKDKMRGMTLFVGFVDEYEYIPYISSVIAGAAPAIISGRNIARETGGRTCMMYASTPGDLETSTGKEAQRMIDMTPPFSEHMYDLTPDEIDNMFNGLNNQEGAGSSNPVSMLYIEFNHIQLRKDDVWLREQYNEAVRTGKLAEYRRGVLLQRFRGG
ncbi:terminase large subunit, partial [human gut metagenome]